MTQSSNDIRESFFQECEDLLETLGEGLRRLDHEGEDIDTVHAVFRAVHSIKGGAGAFGLDALVAFAHRFETALDEVRAGRLARDVAAMRLFHRAGDHLGDMVAAARAGSGPDDGETARLQAELEALIGEPAEDEDEAEAGAGAAFEPMTLDLPALAAPEAGATRYTITFAPEAALYSSGNDPVLVFRALARLGALSAQADIDAVPPLEDLDWREARLRWTLTLVTEEPEEVIREVFEFVEGNCALDISREADEGAPPEAPAGLEVTPELDDFLGAHEADGERASDPAPEVAPVPADDSAPPARPTGQVPGQGGAEAGTRTSATIRVNLDRVDRLINLVGELVIKEAMLSQSISQAGLPAESDVSSGLDGLKQLAGEIQEGVMAIRAQPVKSMFQRMFRIVRETAEISGKRVRLVTQGEHAEVDKTVIERLVDPLTHMIRNAIDHGLEAPQARAAAGKPEEGTLILSASHRSGRVMIDVSDDGAGIDRARVQAAAERKGLVAPGADLAPAEIDNLLFAPGFSSKEEVSNLSGRGVGLDVVKSEIQSLGGRVSITSERGEGTTFSISLPLTLAVLEGMVAEVAGQTIVVPITAVQETLQPAKAGLHAVGRTGRVVESRGELVPIIDLGLAFGYRGPLERLDGHVLLLVETDANRRCALVVDHIHDQRQVVIKSLEDNYGRVAGVAAATILGDGRIALIIDPDEIASTSAGAEPAPEDIPLAAAE
ncbi:chemotaxis protein CheA [Rhodobacteraceae bacterium WD3A24]|nr:chemotaxis protein CheA [Rhodobacteraceae bacterium WD3A24]